MYAADMARRSIPPLKLGRIITSLATGGRYRIREDLGTGGFGTAYRARRVDRLGRKMRDEVCLKLTKDQKSWHREAYFGELFTNNRRVIQVYDSFPLMLSLGGQPSLVFGLALELAPHGTVADYLEHTGRPWSRDRARREVLALLKVLQQLHGGSAYHRDITPFNVFACSRGALKLGDFGIARHHLAGRPMLADAFNSSFVTTRIRSGSRRCWTAMDEVYQMGQILGMLLGGSTAEILTPAHIERLPCDEDLRSVISCATGPRRQRYPDAIQMRKALKAIGRAEP